MWCGVGIEFTYGSLKLFTHTEFEDSSSEHSDRDAHEQSSIVMPKSNDYLCHDNPDDQYSYLP
jgi:hypothetical protein